MFNLTDYRAPAVFAFVLLSSLCPLAQQQTAQEVPLAQVKTLKCTFSASASGTWDNGEARAIAKQPAVPVTFTIDEIDAQEGTARIVSGPSGMAHVVAQLSGWSLHFMDIRPEGSLTITTVFSQESRNKKLKAVYTRTDYLPISLPGFASQPEVSQQYGECEAGR